MVAIPTILEVHEQQFSAIEACHHRIVETAFSLLTQKGVTAFLDEALGLRSKGNMAANNAAWRRWLRERYIEHAFPTRALVTAMREHTAACQQDLAQLDNDLLVQLGIDIDYAPGAAPVYSVDVIAIDAAVDQTMRVITPLIEAANVQGVATFTAGAAVGQVAGNAAMDAMADEHGNVDLLGHATAWIVGLLADGATTVIIDEASQRKEKLNDAVMSESIQLAGYVSATGPAGKSQFGYYAELLKYHKSRLVHEIIKALGVDENWALDVINEALRKRSANRAASAAGN